MRFRSSRTWCGLDSLRSRGLAFVSSNRLALLLRTVAGALLPGSCIRVAAAGLRDAFSVRRRLLDDGADGFPFSLAIERSPLQGHFVRFPLQPSRVQGHHDLVVRVHARNREPYRILRFPVARMQDRKSTRLNS